MSAKIEQPTGVAKSVADVAQLPSPGSVDALADLLRGAKLDQLGTADLVAKLTAQLRGPARKAEGDYHGHLAFHEGFSYELDNIGDRVKREGKVELEVTYPQNAWGKTISIQLSGPPKDVEVIEREIKAAASGAINLRWS